MTQNVLEEVSACFTAPAVSQASAVVGESEAGVRKALPKVVPLVLSSLIKLTEQIGGPEVVWTMASHANEPAEPNDAVAAAAAVGRGSAGRGSELMKSLLADSYRSRVATVASDSGIQPTAVENLLGITAPVMLSVLGRHVSERHLDALGLSRWLQTQRSSISGLLLDEVRPGPINGAAEPGTSPRRPIPSEPATAAPRAESGFWRSWLALFVVAGAVALGFWWLLSRPAPAEQVPAAALVAGSSGSESAVPANAGENSTAARPTAPPTVLSGRYDAATDNYIYDTGRPVRLTLVDGSTQTVGENSTENQLYRFLADASAQVDPVNRTKGWINFDRVYFDARKATLTDESLAQLRNVASILHSFPAARVKIGGYTDSTGAYLSNLKLSEQRATAAMAALIDMGIAARRIEAKGYGPKHAVASNETPVGRALNRRIGLRVTQK
ncbi:OmpA family protein [Hymenobacter sp. B81]|uniref:OmpA family protein n=1 Tax=Hymenobacter sp. B81 TaxID=3344878 RepID=UPI0037DC8ADE